MGMLGVFDGIVPMESNISNYTVQEHIMRYVFAAGYVRGKVVLDVACGAGYGCHFLAMRGAKRVFGVQGSTMLILISNMFRVMCCVCLFGMGFLTLSCLLRLLSMFQMSRSILAKLRGCCSREVFLFVLLRMLGIHGIRSIMFMSSILRSFGGCWRGILGGLRGMGNIFLVFKG